MSQYKQVFCDNKSVVTLRIDERPFKDVHEFARQQIWYWNKSTAPPEWPCMTCSATGRIYDPEDPPCPVEGNKMRGKINCPLCSGSGIGTKEYITAAYNRSIDKWKAQNAHTNELIVLLKSGLSKLTTKEAEAILEACNASNPSMCYDKDPKITKVKIKSCNG